MAEKPEKPAKEEPAEKSGGGSNMPIVAAVMLMGLLNVGAIGGLGYFMVTKMQAIAAAPAAKPAGGHGADGAEGGEGTLHHLLHAGTLSLGWCRGRPGFAAILITNFMREQQRTRPERDPSFTRRYGIPPADDPDVHAMRPRCAPCAQVTHACDFLLRRFAG